MNFLKKNLQDCHRKSFFEKCSEEVERPGHILKGYFPHQFDDLHVPSVPRVPDSSQQDLDKLALRQSRRQSMAMFAQAKK